MPCSLLTRGALAFAGCAAALACGATVAHASVTLGQTTGATDNCGSNEARLQKATATSPSYVAPFSGVVVKWSYLAGTGGPNITFKVYHSTAAPATWFVRSASAERNPGPDVSQVRPNKLNTFDESPGIPIESGDTLGLTARLGTAAGCIETLEGGDVVRVKALPDPPPGADSPGFNGELTSVRVDVSAVVEPDADGDRYGDETQDGCPSDAAVHATACPTDIQIVKTASSNPTVGNDLTYTLSVKNNNTAAAAPDVNITDNLPTGVTFVSSAAGQGTCSGTATVTCALGSLGAGQSTIVNIVVRPNAVGSLSNTADVTTSAPDPDSSNNSSTVAVTVGEAPIVVLPPVLKSLKLTPASFRAKEGTTVTYKNSQNSTTTFTVHKRARGVRKGKKCVAPPRKKPRKKPKSCTRLLRRGTFTHHDTAGSVRFLFKARVGAKTLGPGRYRLRAVARNSAGASLPLTANFTLKKP
jgi:uncharacterized repeat protein (TIGR01451 family)